MKTKLEMAHEWAMKIIEGNVRAADASDLLERAWQYADAMQAEAEKRESKETCDKSLNMANSPQLEWQPDWEEWQPDWSQAPDGAMKWRMFGDGSCIYYDIDGCVLGEAPSFGYTGDWRDSLRKRPQ